MNLFTCWSLKLVYESDAWLCSYDRMTFLFYIYFFSNSLLLFPDDEEGEDHDEELSEGDEQAGQEGRIRQTCIWLET